MERLEVGYQAQNVDEIKSQWIRYNHEQSKTVRCMTVDARKGVYKSVCSCAPIKNGKEWRENTICKAHVFTYKYKVTSIDLEHTCSADQPGRKRQYSAALLSLASEEIREYAGPTRQRGSRTAVQQFSENARAAGFEIGRTQAYRVMQRIKQDPIETHIGQYFLLTKMLKVWKRADTGGTYELDTHEASWNEDLEAFQRCYIAPSFCKHAWQHSKVGFVVLDPSFKTTSHFGHTFFLAVTYDGNNETVLLAFAICDSESDDNWIWFLLNLMKDFPGIQILLLGSKQAIENPNFQHLLQLISAKVSRCVQSLILDYPEKIPKNDRILIRKMALACTPELYNTYLQVVRKRNPQAATWFDERKDQFVSFSFLDAGKKRFAKVANDVAEDPFLKEVMESIQELPIATMLVSLLTKLIATHIERKNKAEKWLEENQLPNSVKQLHDQNIADAANHYVQPVYNKGGVWKAYVSHTKADEPMHRLLVTINTNNFGVECPCRWSQDMGCPCVHCAALLFEKNLHPQDAQWFHARYHVSTLVRMYDAPSTPDFSLSLSGKLSVVTLVPPQQCGERTKKPRTYTPTSNPDTVRVCRACGEKGHNHKTCQNPSTRYQFQRFSEQAKKWAESQTDVKVMTM
jgi:hypothetical protein